MFITHTTTKKIINITVPIVVLFLLAVIVGKFVVFNPEVTCIDFVLFPVWAVIIIPVSLFLILYGFFDSSSSYSGETTGLGFAILSVYLLPLSFGLSCLPYQTYVFEQTEYDLVSMESELKDKGIEFSHIENNSITKDRIKVKVYLFEEEYCYESATQLQLDIDIDDLEKYKY